MNPSNPVYHYHLGLAYIQSDDEIRGRESIERALGLKVDFADAANARQVLASLVSTKGR